MEKWKDITQYSTAVTALVSGIALAFIQYFGTGDLSNGVLGYVAQVLVYAAGIFGVTMYWNGKSREVMNILTDKYNKLEQEIKNDRNTNVVSSESK
jgi:hypothetical protein